MNTKRLLLFIVVMGVLLLGLTDRVYAKLLPRFQSSGGTSSGPVSTKSYSGVMVSPRFMPARNGLRVSFSGLNNATSVSYTLTYETNGKQEGVSGSVNPSEGSTSRDLQFGTCSSGTCVAHKNIKNMKLEVTCKLTSGKTTIKRYSIRV